MWGLLALVANFPAVSGSREYRGAGPADTGPPAPKPLPVCRSCPRGCRDTVLACPGSGPPSHTPSVLMAGPQPHLADSPPSGLADQPRLPGHMSPRWQAGPCLPHGLSVGWGVPGPRFWARTVAPAVLLASRVLAALTHLRVPEVPGAAAFLSSRVGPVLGARCGE